MAQTLFFYDLETSGFSAARDRIMQFAGQRTDTQFNPIGDPYNVLVKLPPDVLPGPEAVLFTGLSLSENRQKGISEPQFTKLFNEEIASPGTIFIGFNNLRFDDEFIRYSNYRNFYDAYSWHWSLERSRWDLLDAVRMTRSLRPEGIKWPISLEGKNTNRLELLTKANNLDHHKAHDALSDVLATIELAKLIASKQPKLFKYLLGLRYKKESNKVINLGQPFIYTSGRYPSEWLHTTVVSTMEFNPDNSTAQVYDLRVDPRLLLDLSTEELIDMWRYDPEKPRIDMPIKTIKLNRCPAVAPLSVLDKDSISRLDLDMDQIERNEKLLKEHKDEFNQKINSVIATLNEGRDSRQKSSKSYADQKLYDKFISPADQKLFSKVHSKPIDSGIVFSEKRLNDLLLFYLARNFHELLDKEQLSKWSALVNDRLFAGNESDFAKYNLQIAELKKSHKNKKLIKELEELAKTIEDDYGKPGLAERVSG